MFKDSRVGEGRCQRWARCQPSVSRASTQKPRGGRRKAFEGDRLEAIDLVEAGVWVAKGSRSRQRSFSVRHMHTAAMRSAIVRCASDAFPSTPMHEKRVEHRRGDASSWRSPSCGRKNFAARFRYRLGASFTQEIPSTNMAISRLSHDNTLRARLSMLCSHKIDLCNFAACSGDTRDRFDRSCSRELFQQSAQLVNAKTSRTLP